MGSPRKYYREALKNMTYNLTYIEDKEKAKKLLDESNEILEDIILNKKKELSVQDFYFKAGESAQQTLIDADNDNCDAFNACIAGIIEFEQLIGLLRE